jgi:hypothetical protein
MFMPGRVVAQVGRSNAKLIASTKTAASAADAPPSAGGWFNVVCLPAVRARRYDDLPVPPAIPCAS